MSSSQYITVRETAQILGINEKKVMDLVDSNKLQAYKIAGQFLRLKKADVVGIKNSGTVVSETVQFKYTGGERISDFFYYNDFYIFSAFIIGTLLFVIYYF